MKKILTNIFFVVVFFSMVNFTYASSITSTKINKNQPLNITSNKVEIIRNKGEIIFIGDVIATQDEFTLYADKMTVKYNESKDQKVNIDNIKATKNVKFVNQAIVATGDEGTYDVKKNIITMKKNIKATEKGITVYADEFSYDVNTGKTNIIGNKQQNERVVIILDNLNDLNKK